MKITEKLENKIDKLLYDYEKIKIENKHLQQKIDELENENDELKRNNEDMFLRIDSTLTFSKANKND